MSSNYCKGKNIIDVTMVYSSRDVEAIIFKIKAKKPLPSMISTKINGVHFKNLFE